MKNIKHAFFMCLGMFTSIPCPYRPWDEEARPMMTACLPAVGLIVGVLWALGAALARLILPGTLAAAAMASLPFLLTGFMHLDGFMDTADAVLSWRDREERQKILKDVHCGSFAVVCLALLLLGMFAAANDALKGDLRALVLIPAVSRCMSAFCVTALKPIGHSEYAGMHRSVVTPLTALILLALSFLIGMIWLGAKTGLILLAVVLGYSAAMLQAGRSLGGVSGDLAGYSLSIGELCGLAVLAMLTVR